jgi:hypothetical protein
VKGTATETITLILGVGGGDTHPGRGLVLGLGREGLGRGGRGLDGGPQVGLLGLPRPRAARPLVDEPRGLGREGHDY